MEYSEENENLILPDITKSSIRSRENGANYNYNNDYSYNKLKSDNKSKNQFSPIDLAEAFNQIKNAKFKVLSKIEKLKQIKHPRNYDYEDYQENYNNAYNFINENDKAEISRYPRSKN
jgi:hypothetical protein